MLKNICKTTMFVVLSVFVFSVTSCSKSDEDVLDSVTKSAIQQILAKKSLPSVKEVDAQLAKISAAPAQKAPGGMQKAKSSVISTRIELLESSYSVVSATEATRFLGLYSIAGDGVCAKLFVVSQTFPVSGGVVDTLAIPQYGTRWASDFSREFQLESGEKTGKATAFFHFDGGRELSYFPAMENGSLFLLPLASGKWQINTEITDDRLKMQFHTGLIDYHGSKQLKYDVGNVSSSNTVAVVHIASAVVSANYLLTFTGRDINGNQLLFCIATLAYQGMADEVKFEVPFDPETCAVSGEVPGVYNLDPTTGSNGIYHYNLGTFMPN